MASTNATSGAGNVAAAADVESGGTTGTAPAATVKDGSLNSKKFGEPLFGPNIGSVSSGPSWTVSSDKKVSTDELTTETVTGWIEKSKEVSVPATIRPSIIVWPAMSSPLCTGLRRSAAYALINAQYSRLRP